MGKNDMAVTRRNVLTFAAASALLPASVMALGRSSPRRPRLFVYDATVPHALEVVRRLKAVRIICEAVEGDLSVKWQQLSKQWAHKPFATAGLTTKSAFACFDILARGRRLKCTALDAFSGSRNELGNLTARVLSFGAPDVSDRLIASAYVSWTFVPIAELPSLKV